MTLHHGDCLDVMPTLPAESFDAIVTDPPYGLGFMGKDWDRHGMERRTAVQHNSILPAGGQAAFEWQPTAYQDWCYRWAVECLRLAKPGAHLLAFGGTRTYHRLACAIEDAGWEVRDCLVWAYASGFPKSRNLDGEWQGWGTALKPAWEPIVLARKPLRGTVAANVQRYGTGALNINGYRIGYEPEDATTVAAKQSKNPTGRAGLYGVPGIATFTPSGRWPANVILTDPIFDGDTPGVVGGGATEGGGNINGRPVTGYSKIWADERFFGGYGDSGTYSRFFQLQEGDGCYLCGRAMPAGETSSPRSASGGSVPDPAQTAEYRETGGDRPMASPPTSEIERPFWPDESGSTPSILRSRRRGTSPASAPLSNPARSRDVDGQATDTTMTMPGRWTCDTCADLTTSHITFEPGDTRFLLVPKAARSDREPVLGGLPVEGPRVLNSGSSGRTLLPDGTWQETHSEPRRRANHHPTVKPTELMRHLVRLVTPPGGTVLDPFLGSGSTALACEMEGFGWVGIEKEAEYVAIAEARLNGTQRGIGL